jgi:SAM-dependent methyltransferase
MREGRPPVPHEYTTIDGIRCYAPALAKHHGDYPSEGFDVTAQVEARSFWCQTRNRIVRLMIERFTERRRPLDLLEIGCGTGNVLTALRCIPNLRLTGSEIYLHGLRYARMRLPDVDFIQLDATEIPFDREFDVVGAFDVIEHIASDQQVMREVHDSLRPGGLFIVTVPQYQWMWSRLDEIVRHKRRYSRGELASKLRTAGFDVLYTTSFVTTLFPIMALVRVRARMGRRSTVGEAAEFASQVDLPAPLNRFCGWLTRLDECVLKAGLSLPFGGSLLVVARRPGGESVDCSD